VPVALGRVQIGPGASNKESSKNWRDAQPGKNPDLHIAGRRVLDSRSDAARRFKLKLTDYIKWPTEVYPFLLRSRWTDQDQSDPNSEEILCEGELIKTINPIIRGWATTTAAPKSESASTSWMAGRSKTVVDRTKQWRTRLEGLSQTAVEGFKWSACLTDPFSLS